MQLNFKFEAGDNKEYKVEGMENSAVYARESVKQLSGLYYLVLWKGYLEKKNIWEPTLVIQHLWRLITTYHKDNLEKLIATSIPVNTAPTIAKLIALSMAKLTAALTKKRSWLAKTTTTTITKQAKKS